MPSLNSDTDVHQHLHITRNSDGSLTRNYPFPFTSPNDPTNWPVVSKDVVLSSARGTSIRIFVPNTPTSRKLPILLYFHGGGFILCSPSIAPVHDYTSRMAANLPAAVLSVDHRLAPEHRLPAAYDDALDALLWVRDHAESELLLKDRLDYSQCFLMGSSSGGNIAYHLAIRVAAMELAPVRVAGLVMDQPFFGGEERTESERRMKDDRLVPVAVTDLMWELALPVGTDRDHEYSNVRRLTKVKGLPARCWVRGCVGDPLIDRMRTVAAMMEEAGVRVVKLLNEEGLHGAEMFNASKADAMVAQLRDFIYA